MTILDDLRQWQKDQFNVLILDNEVTVSEFVIDPPVPWTRLVQKNGVFQMADGYPAKLTAAQAKFEMTNWDEVSLPAIGTLLRESAACFDFFIFGNNAGQGVPLAQALPKQWAAAQAAVIYASSLPEKSAYEQLDYRNFWRRKDTTPQLLQLAQSASRPLALFLINTIQHNDANYHSPR